MGAYRTFTDIQAFVDALRETDLVSDITGSCDLSRTEVDRLLTIYMNEMHVGFSAICAHLSPSQRILEVGAGLGLMSAFLAQQGYQVTSLEPVGAGFGFFMAAREGIQKYVPVAPREILRISAEALNSGEHGTFDLIFSIHALEHMERCLEAIRAMASVLDQSGHMVHLCPNYLFPYDPHFNIPLAPIFPKLTRLFVPAKIANTDLWKSLNFITYFDVKRVARQEGLDTTFRGGQFADNLDRLSKDDVFAERHPGMAKKVKRILETTSLDKLFALMPKWLDSPMLFELRRQKSNRPGV